MPQLSIIIPFYNVERYIAPCLESIRRQTLYDVEVILVDDGSLDGTRQVAEGFCDLDNRFRLVTQENRGLGPARNAGVPEASGEYLTFVDGDDVIPLDAYASMVAMLDESGSDFVVGSANRFNNFGVVPSIVHARVCDRTRTGTHARSEPVLALDRMAWNKVYRTEFWNEQGLSFPAMLLEDFPVSVAAHSRARAVDVSAQVGYLWRVRDGGEPSITQRSAEVGNISDRLASALMVLDVVEAELPSSLLQVQQHLLHIDVDAMVAAMALNSEEDRGTILKLAQRLLERVRPVGDAEAVYHRLQASLVERGDIDGLLMLRAHVSRYGRRGALERKGTIRKRFYETSLPLFGTDRAPREVFRADPVLEEIKVAAHDAWWDEGRIVFDLTLESPLRLGTGSRLRVWLVPPGSGSRIELQAERYARLSPLVGQDLTGARVSVDPGELPVGDSGSITFWHLEVELEAPGISGTVRVIAPPFGRGRFIPGRFLPGGDGLHVQPRRQSDRGLGLQFRRPLVVLEAIEVSKEGLVLHGRLGARPVGEAGAELVLTKRGGEKLSFPVRLTPLDADGEASAFECTVPAKGLARFPDYLDPVAVQRFYAARLSFDGAARPLVLADGVESVQHVLGTRSLTATTNAGGNLELVEVRVSPVVMAVRWVKDDVLRFEGTWDGEEALPDEILLEHFERPADEAAVRVPLEQDGRDYSFEIDVPALIELQAARSAAYLGPGHRPWHLQVPFGSHIATQVFARDRLPTFAEPRRVAGHEVNLLTTRNDVVQLAISALSSD